MNMAEPQRADDTSQAIAEIACALRARRIKRLQELAQRHRREAEAGQMRAAKWRERRNST